MAWHSPSQNDERRGLAMTIYRWMTVGANVTGTGWRFTGWRVLLCLKVTFKLAEEDVYYTFLRERKSSLSL